MDHGDWVQGELKELGRTQGFQYTPLKEIVNRLSRTRMAMRRQEIDALLVVQNEHPLYLSDVLTLQIVPDSVQIEPATEKLS